MMTAPDRLAKSVSSSLLCMFYVFERWLTVASYALIGSILFAYGSRPLGNWWSLLLAVISSGNEAFEFFASLTVATMVIILLHQFAQTRLPHIRWFSYPALPWAVILALLVAPSWASFCHWGAAVE